MKGKIFIIIYDIDDDNNKEIVPSFCLYKQDITI